MDVFSPSDMPQLMALGPRKGRSVRAWYFIFAASHMSRIRKVIQRDGIGCCPRRANASNSSAAGEQTNKCWSPFAGTWADASVSC